MTNCKKPSRNRYSDLTSSEDTYEHSSQVSVQSETAFQTGIHFDARFIGSMEVPKPTNRTDIVIAMRRIRFEYKANSVKKRPIKIIVSVSGIKVTYKLPRKVMKFAKQANVTEQILFSHPIYRVFYVSHDSQDLKIFSYIARDCGTNIFKCNVFKAEKKNVAMLIVRTIGQAFEVCHKFTKEDTLPELDKTDLEIQKEKIEDDRDKMRDSGLSGYSISDSFVHIPYTPEGNNLDPKLMVLESSPLGRDNEDSGSFSKTPSPEEFNMAGPEVGKTADLRFPSIGDETTMNQPEIFLLKQHLRRKTHEIQMSQGQLALLKEQMKAEVKARYEAEKKVRQLLVQNEELLQQIQQLVDKNKACFPVHSCLKDTKLVSQEYCPKHSPHKRILTPIMDAAILNRDRFTSCGSNNIYATSCLNKISGPETYVSNAHLTPRAKRGEVVKYTSCQNPYLISTCLGGSDEWRRPSCAITWVNIPSSPPTSLPPTSGLYSHPPQRTAVYT